jgi:TolB-like protein/Flp pilus assembly protein TadD
MIKETAEQVRSDALVESFGDKSIAVLPFVNMSDDKDNEYFSDGISEELINLLSQIPELRVIARTSAFYYKDKNVKLTQVGEELGVNHILEGSVRKAGDRVRVTAQLIEAGSESHIWSETYDRTFADIFEIQDEIAVNVAERLKITLFGRQAKSKKVNPEAYALFLQASHFSFQWTPEGVEQGFDLLQQAVTLDPNYARAWGAMAFKPYFEAMTGKVSYEEGLKNARRALGKALEIDPYDASSHAWMGFYLLLDWDYEGAAEFVQRALELNTADNGVRYVASILLGVLQRTEEAVSVTEQLLLRNPVEADLHATLGEQYLSLGRFDDALASFQMAVTLDPSFTVYLGRFQLMRGDAQSALEIVDGLESPAWDPSAGLLLRMMASYSLGKEEIYLAAQSELISRWGEYDPIAVACGFAWTEETDLAFDWLSKAVSSHSPFISSVTTNPCFKPIHYDPRWSTLLRQTGLAPEQMAAIQFNVPQSD